MRGGGSFLEQNGSSGDGCLPEPGGAVNGGEGDCEFMLDILPWTSEEGEFLDMCEAAFAASAAVEGGGGGGENGRGVFKEDLKPPSTTEIKAINGCHGSNGGDGEDGGVAVKEDQEPPSTMENEAINECGRGSDGSSGSGEDSGDNSGGGEEKVMRKGPWTAAEDVLLMKVVEELGPGDWVAIERYSGLARTSKSCRLRWTNHLRPNLKKGSFSLEEERHVVKMHYKYGNKWSRMARHLPGRTDNEIKNFWHSRVKKCKKQGLPIYPDWCNEEEDETSTDNDGENYDVGDQPNHISNPADDFGTAHLFAAASLPEVQLAPPPPPYRHDQESLPRCSNQTLQRNSSFSSKDPLSFTQQPTPSYQTSEIPISEFHSSQAQLSLSCQQPHISSHDIYQQQQSSTFHSNQTSLSASIPSSEMQYYSSQGQYFLSGPSYLSSSDKQIPMNHSTQTPLLPIDPPSQTQIPSTHNFLSSKPKPSPMSPSNSNSFALPQLSPPQQNRSASAQQPSSKCHSNLNSNSIAFKPLRPPPILSPPSGRFKRFHRTTSQLPPVPKPTQLSFPEQGQSVPASAASAASVSPFLLNTSNSVPHSSSELKSPTIESPRSSFKLNLSTNVPTSTSVQLNKPKLRSSASCPDMDKLLSCFQLNSSTSASPHSFPRLKPSAPALPESHGQINSSITASPGSSLKRCLPTSELPVSSQQLNSSPSPGYSSIFKSEPPSIQPPRRDLKPNPEMKPNLNNSKSKSYFDLLDASLLQEAQAESSLSDLHLVKGYLLSKRLKTKHLYGNMLARRMSQNISSNKGVMLGESPCREGPLSGSLGAVDLLGQSRTREVMMSKRPDTQDLMGNYSSRNFPLNGSSKTINFSSGKSTKDCSSNFGSYAKDLLGKSGQIAVPNNNSRKLDLLRNITKGEGLLCEVSKTGVLLVENTRKEILLSKLLKRQNSMGVSSQREVSLREGSMPEDLTWIDSFDSEQFLRENLLRESSKRKGPMTESMEKECPMSTWSKRDQNSREVLLGKNLSEGFLNPREQASVPGELGHLNVTSLSVSSDVSGGNLHSAQIPASDFLDSMSESSKKICLRDENLMGISFGESSEREGPLAIHGQEYALEAPGPLFSQSTVTPPLRFANSFGESTYFQSSQGDCSAQTLMNNFLDETLKSEGLLDSQDQLHGICESSLLPCQYVAPGLIKSSPPVAELSSSQTSTSESLDRSVKTEDSLCKSLGKSNTCDENLGKELLKVNSREEPVLASTELKPSQNGLDSVISQSTTPYKSNSGDQSGKSGSGYCSGDFEELMRARSQEEKELASQKQKPLHNGSHPVIFQSTEAHMLESCHQSGESGSAHCSSGEKVQHEPEEEHVNAMAEELSSLLEFFPTSALEFPDMEFLDELDMYPAFDMSFDSSTPPLIA